MQLVFTSAIALWPGGSCSNACRKHSCCKNWSAISKANLMALESILKAKRDFSAADHEVYPLLSRNYQIFHKWTVAPPYRLKMTSKCQLQDEGPTLCRILTPCLKDKFISATADNLISVNLPLSNSFLSDLMAPASPGMRKMPSTVNPELWSKIRWHSRILMLLQYGLNSYDTVL